VKKFKSLIIVVFITLLLLPSCGAYSAKTSIAQSDTLIEWNPVCRHDALYWLSVVRDQYPVRVVFGKVIDPIYDWHVQPQLLLGENWYYFEVKEGSVYIILDMPSLYEGWVVLYHMNVEDYVNWLFGTDLKESRGE
jgi:hypothetical protein